MKLAPFVQELEEDPDMRKHVAVYKLPSTGLVEAADQANESQMDEDSDVAEAELEVPLEELLDDLEGLAVHDE